MSTTKTCVTCTKEIHGRADKIYCSKKCQNQHHKITRLETFVIQQKKYSNRIKRNYVVLRGVMSIRSKRVIVHKNNLVKNGFDFHHFLQKDVENGGDVYRIKEFQFKDLGNGKIEVIRLWKGADYSPEFVDRWSREFSLNDVLFNVDYEEGDVEHFSGEVYYYFERIDDYQNKCLVTKATNLLRLQRERTNK